VGVGKPGPLQTADRGAENTGPGHEWKSRLTRRKTGGGEEAVQTERLEKQGHRSPLKPSEEDDQHELLSSEQRRTA